DITSRAIIPPDLQGRAMLVARQAGVVAGLPVVELVLETFHTPLLRFEPQVEDGARVEPGARLAVITGLMESILTAERTALNFLQRLSGVATLTRRYVDAVAGLPCQILDTRKTTPGWRLLEKYAVRCGGGHNHRLGLYGGFLVKDNHLAALGGGKEAFQKVLRAVSEYRKETMPIPFEVEVDTLEQLETALTRLPGAEVETQDALACLPDIVLLDNMRPQQLQEAVRRRNEKAPKVLLEASGGVTLETVRAIAETGVDRISVGALTHSAPALDIGLDYLNHG
ncbi:MAG: carboxylating nicotinate-nucleotide diphosphorylase, partial [Planctomycetes bacterium]|nr:carboxylating nicotinate-nucleotide diphosphorylase [Planctomycetota bacterium]